MTKGWNHTAEQRALAAFDAQAAVFDQLYAEDVIVRYKRSRVREHVSGLLAPGSAILELNSGTGEDAIYFARRGHRVHATDLSGQMQKVLQEKTRDQAGRVTQEICSFTELEKLREPGPYDLVFSNLAGLNCTAELEKVLRSLPALVKPGGLVTLVILPRFCLWEFLLLFKGKFRTAFRRFSGKKGTVAKVEGKSFRCWYYNPSFVRNRMNQAFEQISLEGLCCLVPPSYMQGFADRHPRWYRFLVKMENKWKNKWPWRTIGDYYIQTFRKR